LDKSSIEGGKKPRRRPGQEQHGEPSGRLSDSRRRGANVPPRNGPRWRWEAFLAANLSRPLSGEPPIGQAPSSCRFVLMLSALLRAAFSVSRRRDGGGWSPSRRR